MELYVLFQTKDDNQDIIGVFSSIKLAKEAWSTWILEQRDQTYYGEILKYVLDDIYRFEQVDAWEYIRLDQ